MAEFEASSGMPAMKEIVFAEASRLDMIGQWLDENNARLDEALSADAPTWRVEWGGSAADGYPGWLQVSDAGAGSSEATLHVSVAGDLPAEDSGAEIEQRLARTLSQLYDSVLQRVNDAS
jgi:hypothetical protein